MAPLSSARIWLSGSIEDPKSEEGKKTAAFVEAFATAVFREGGTIVHGCQPDFMPILLKAAETFIGGRPIKAKLALMVSRLYSKSPKENKVDIPEWEKVCAEPVVETREALTKTRTEEAAYQESLEILRTQLCGQSNVVVAVGGKWWKTDTANAGVPIEIEMARTRQLPQFLLGGLGGAAAGLLEAKPELLRQCRNGQTEEDNMALAQLADPIALANQVAEAIARLPLPARTEHSGRPFRILCLDGGGICGTFTASVLARWEEKIGCKIVDHFDLIAGTSTGGILAIGLGLGLSAAQLLQFYTKQGPTIFPNHSGVRGVLHSVRHWFQSGYDQKVLKTCIEEALKGRGTHLQASKTRLLIPSYDSVADSVLLFRTPDGHRNKSDQWESVLSAQATAAAPTYFDPVDVNTYRAIDGGVWANSPTLAALAEAIYELGVTCDRIEMLSVGTTTGPALLGHPIAVNSSFIELLLSPLFRGPIGWAMRKLAGSMWKPKKLNGIIGWLPNIAGFLMKTQSQATTHAIERILGSDRFRRVDAATLDIAMDDAQAINLLTNLGATAADDHRDYVEERFLNRVPVESWK